MDAQAKVSRAVTRLVVKHPFFGSMCLSVNVKSDDSIPTMCTDGRSILWSPSFVDTMGQEETVGVMAHEVLHIVFKHHLRRGARDPELWNIATDFAINQVLVDNGFTLPKGGLIDEAPAARLHQALRVEMPEVAPLLAREAGWRTGGYILEHRIPQKAQRLLRLMPARLSAPMLARAA